MIVISLPTRRRPEKLSRCLASILSSTFNDIVVVIVCANIKEDLGYHAESHHIRIYERPEFSVVESHNFVSEKAEQGDLLACSDDMEFMPGCFESLIDCMEKNFPDRDGVIGLNTINMVAKDTSMMLVGETYRKRFDRGRIYFPGYFHFAADTELGETAKRFGRYRFCEEAKIRHHHPVSGVPIDETHEFARRHLHHDLNLFEERMRQGKIWGNHEELSGHSVSHQ